MPKLPDTINSITLPDEWSETLDGRNFVIADDGFGDDRIIVSVFLHFLHL